jgi:hypothetical protein
MTSTAFESCRRATLDDRLDRYVARSQIQGIMSTDRNRPAISLTKAGFKFYRCGESSLVEPRRAAPLSAAVRWRPTAAARCVPQAS